MVEFSVFVRRQLASDTPALTPSTHHHRKSTRSDKVDDKYQDYLSNNNTYRVHVSRLNPSVHCQRSTSCREATEQGRPTPMLTSPKSSLTPCQGGVYSTAKRHTRHSCQKFTLHMCSRNMSHYWTQSRRYHNSTTRHHINQGVRCISTPLPPQVGRASRSLLGGGVQERDDTIDCEYFRFELANSFALPLSRKLEQGLISTS